MLQSINAVCAMVDRMPVEEGWVYGQKPKEPEARSACLFWGQSVVILNEFRRHRISKVFLKRLGCRRHFSLSLPFLHLDHAATAHRYQTSLQTGNHLFLLNGMQGRKRGQRMSFSG